MLNGEGKGKHPEGHKGNCFNLQMRNKKNNTGHIFPLVPVWAGFSWRTPSGDKRGASVWRSSFACSASQQFLWVGGRPLCAAAPAASGLALHFLPTYAPAREETSRTDMWEHLILLSLSSEWLLLCIAWTDGIKRILSSSPEKHCKLRTQTFISVWEQCQDSCTGMQLQYHRYVWEEIQDQF